MSKNTVRALLLTFSLISIPVPASAQSIPATSFSSAETQSIDFAFAPPIGTVLRYEQARSSALDGRLTGAKLIYDYRFERRDGGYLVWVELMEIEGLGDEQRARFAEAVAAPMLNIRYAIELSPDGDPLAIRDEDAIWAITLRGIALIEAEMRSRPNISEDERAQMLNILATIQAQDGETRRQGMLIVIEDLIALAGRSITIGENPHSEESASPLGGTVQLSGLISAELTGEDMARLEIAGTTETAEQFIIHERIVYRAAPSSGLVHHMDRSRTFEAPTNSDAPAYSETVTLRLIEEIPAGNPVLPGAN